MRACADHEPICTVTGLQDVVDVHEIQEDLMIQRGADPQSDTARKAAKSRSNLANGTGTCRALPVAGSTATADRVLEGDGEQNLEAVLSATADATGSPADEGHVASDTAPLTASNLPPGEAGLQQLDSDRAVFVDEPTLQSTSSKVVLLQSNPGLAKLASDVPTDAVPLDNFEDVSNSDWGLDMLVRVGESWAPNLLTMTPCDPTCPCAGPW